MITVSRTVVPLASVLLLVAGVFAQTTTSGAEVARSTTRPVADTSASPARFIPENVDVYLEISDLGHFVDDLPDSPLAATLRETGLLEKMNEDDGFAKLTGMFTALSRMLHDRVGVSLRMQPAGPRILLVARRREGRTHEEVIAEVMKLAPEAERGDVDEVAGATLTALGAAGIVAERGDWFYWSTHPFHIRRALRTDPQESLHATARYAALKLPRQDAAFAMCAVPERLLSDYGDDMEIDNAVGILLFQGLVDDLRAAKEATAWGRLAPWPDLEIRMERDEPAAGWAAANRKDRHWISPLGRDIGGIRLDRDLSEFWHRRHDVLPESAHQGLAEFTQTMNTFLSGFPFDDIMKHVKPGAQLLAAPQKFAAGDLPELRLPAFAVVLQTDLDQGLRDRMRVAFQTTIGVVNATAAEENRQPLLQLSRDVDGVEVLGTRFLDDPRDGRKAIAYNFSPSLAFVDTTLILSSTLPFAEALVQRLKGHQTTPAVGDRVLLRGPAAVAALRLNSGVLAEEMMLEDGIDLDEAERRVEILLNAVSRIGEFDLRHVDDARGSTWSLSVTGREEPTDR